MLEYNLIKPHRPRFNVRYRDDKSYPYLALTVGETWPRAQVMRGAKRKNVRYFGPFGHAYAIRETLDALTRVFPVRTCTNSFFDSAGPGPAPVPVLRHRPVRRALRAGGRPASPRSRYRAQVDALGDFLCGQLRARRRTAGRPRCGTSAERQEYERAAKLRDQLAAARRAMETRRWCSPSRRTST